MYFNQVQRVRKILNELGSMVNRKHNCITSLDSFSDAGVGTERSHPDGVAGVCVVQSSVPLRDQSELLRVLGRHLQ